ncbi:MAG TPA: chitosanase [Chitinophagaceae bacterium]|nr:chitosanase [Chitinophagaceae bacterium]
MITPPIKKKIQDVISVFETSSVKPRYDILVTLHDGPGKCLQITYGKHQTTEYGNLKALIKMYCDSYGRYASDLRSYLAYIGRPDTPLAKNESFKHLLKLAGTDYTMHEVQDKFFDQYYWDPAFKFFQQNNFSLPLSMLVIYDSYVHSGGILDFLRRRFGERTPINSGNERRWIKAYTSVRDKWLENHTNEILPPTDYRTDCLLEAIDTNNWELQHPVICKFNSFKQKDWVTIR